MRLTNIIFTTKLLKYNNDNYFSGPNAFAEPVGTMNKVQCWKVNCFNVGMIAC